MAVHRLFIILFAFRRAADVYACYEPDFLGDYRYWLKFVVGIRTTQIFLSLVVGQGAARLTNSFQVPATILNLLRKLMKEKRTKFFLMKIRMTRYIRSGQFKKEKATQRMTREIQLRMSSKRCYIHT